MHLLLIACTPYYPLRISLPASLEKEARQALQKAQLSSVTPTRPGLVPFSPAASLSCSCSLPGLVIHLRLLPAPDLFCFYPPHHLPVHPFSSSLASLFPFFLPLFHMFFIFLFFSFDTATGRAMRNTLPLYRLRGPAPHDPQQTGWRSRAR